MHIDSSTYTTPDGRTYTRHLLRESYRSGGKVLKRTLANLSHLEPERLEALRLALAHKGPVCELANVSVELELRQGASVAAVLTVLETARRLGIVEALGGGEEGRRALWQVLARCLEQGSRLSAVRLARRLEADRLLGLGPFAEDGRRYVLHRNPVQAEVCAARRADPLATWQRQVDRANTYLAKHPRACPQKACQRLTALATRLRLQTWTSLEVKGRTLQPVIDEQAHAEAAKLDGCYALITDLTAAQASKELIDARYHDLAQVERVFRTAKTALLEMRPVYVRLESRTRGHALVVMLAYMLARSLGDCWRALDLTVEEGLEELKELCTTQVWVRGRLAFTAVPQPRDSTQALLAAAGIDLSAMLPRAGRLGAAANTRRKLPSQRRERRSRKATVDTNGSSTAEP